jgi:hypothetical protein
MDLDALTQGAQQARYDQTSEHFRFSNVRRSTLDRHCLLILLMGVQSVCHRLRPAQQHNTRA